ncbi:MAG TPA: addiction module protein [Thermoanaerobaculia bacterium]|nr:addiction module protein [Thermoanaerobaculia bacterium]
MASTPISDILRLSVAERLQIVGEIWESIASEPDTLPLTEAQRKEILRRSEAHKANPREAIPLDESIERIRRSL